MVRQRIDVLQILNGFCFSVPKNVFHVASAFLSDIDAEGKNIIRKDKSCQWIC